jgi:hypothetical protein
MIEGFESIEAFAKMNYVIDIVKGNVPPIHWDSLSKDEKYMWISEAKCAEYVLTEDDIDNILHAIVHKQSVHKDFDHG